LCAVIFHMGIIPLLTLGFSACVLKTSCPPIDESGLYHTANRWNTISKVFTNYNKTSLPNGRLILFMVMLFCFSDYF